MLFRSCAESGIGRVTVVPVAAPCRAGTQLGGKRTFMLAGQERGVQVTTVYAEHSNNASLAMLTETGRAPLAGDDLNAYVGHANGFVLAFSNGLRVYLSGDTGIHTEMKSVVGDFHKANLVLLNYGSSAISAYSATYAMNELIKPAAVIATQVNERATVGGKLRPESRTAALVKMQKRPVHLAISGRTMEFDGKANCVAGCKIGRAHV